jgi:hypothetical protein
MEAHKVDEIIDTMLLDMSEGKGDGLCDAAELVGCEDLFKKFLNSFDGAYSQNYCLGYVTIADSRQWWACEYDRIKAPINLLK